MMEQAGHMPFLHEGGFMTAPRPLIVGAHAVALLNTCAPLGRGPRPLRASGAWRPL